MTTCYDCKYRISQDEGYSSYTVEGTTFYCAKNLHPEAPFDQFYGGDARVEYGAKCESFSEGEGIGMDVEQYELDQLTEEQKLIWALHLANS